MHHAVMGYVYRRLTNTIKPLIGKNKFHLQQDKFVALLIKHRLSLGIIPLQYKITSSARSNEGAGSQALLAMYAINFSITHNIPYRHSKFSQLAHAERSMVEWCRVWEDYFSLGFNEVDLESDQDDVINFQACFHLIQRVYKIEDFADHFPLTLNAFKEKYYSNKQKPVKKTNHLNVCIHIRRGDVSPHSYPLFWSEPEIVYNCLKQLVNILRKKNLNVELNLFSQGAANEFEFLDEFEIQYHLDEDAVWSHTQLVQADVLVMAKSTYSYVAALLGEGVKLYEPSGIPYKITPLNDWLIRSADGSFSEAQFILQLKTLPHINMNSDPQI